MYCTMVSEMILKCGIFNPGYSLEKMADRYLGFKYSKTNQLSLFDTPTTRLSKTRRDEFRHIGITPLTNDQVEYGLTDVEFTWSIYEKQLPLIAEADLGRTLLLEMNYLKVLGDIEYAGFYIDPVRWEALYKKNLQRYKELRQELVDYIKVNELKEFYDFQLSLFELDFENPNLEVAINFSSSQQIVTLLNAFGISTKILDKEKSKQTGQEE